MKEWAKYKSVAHYFASHFVANGKCRLWTGSKNNGGYGVASIQGKRGLAHRMHYEHVIGKLRKGRFLDHLCRNRLCIRLAHLEPVSLRENIRRGLNGVLKTHCINGHPWIKENIYRAKNGDGTCRICKVTVHKKKWKEDHNVV